MTTTQTSSTKTTWIRRLAAGTALAAAPAIIALGAAAPGHADYPIEDPGPAMTSQVQLPPFPYQTNAPQPGTPTHHHHQNHHG